MRAGPGRAPDSGQWTTGKKMMIFEDPGGDEDSENKDSGEHWHVL